MVCSLQGQDDRMTLKIQRAYFENCSLQDGCEAGVVQASFLRLILISIRPGKAYLSCRPCLSLQGELRAKSATL